MTIHVGNLAELHRYLLSVLSKPKEKRTDKPLNEMKTEDMSAFIVL